MAASLCLVVVRLLVIVLSIFAATAAQPDPQAERKRTDGDDR